jgi:hypothetical protein
MFLHRVYLALAAAAHIAKSLFFVGALIISRELSFAQHSLLYLLCSTSQQDVIGYNINNLVELFWLAADNLFNQLRVIWQAVSDASSPAPRASRDKSTSQIAR